MDDPLNPLKKWRFDNGLTQGQAAQEIGVSQPTWGAWERGVCLPLARQAHQIRLRTGVSYEELRRWRSAGAAA